MFSVQCLEEEEVTKTLEHIGTHENTLEHCGLPVTKVINETK
jgi:hypothetical protein